MCFLTGIQRIDFSFRGERIISDLKGAQFAVLTVIKASNFISANYPTTKLTVFGFEKNVNLFQFSLSGGPKTSY